MNGTPAERPPRGAGPDAADDREPPPRWAARLLDRLGRRWWLVSAALLPVVCGSVACGLSVAGMRSLVAAGLPAGELLSAEIPRAVLLCLWPGLAAAGVVVFTAPAYSARPLAVLCAGAASWLALDAGAQDFRMTRQGRGEGARRVSEVWIAPAALGTLAFVLYLEHLHGAHGVRRRDEEPGAFPRLWRGPEG